MNQLSKKCFLSKVNNNCIKLISINISFLRVMEIIRYSKKYQSLLDVSPLNYKKYFLLKSIPINYTTIPVTELSYLLNKDFENFNKLGEENVLENIVKGINESEEVIKVNKKDNDILKDYKEKKLFSDKFQNVLMRRVVDNSNKAKLIALYLDSKNDENISTNNSINPQLEQLSLKKCSFPNLTILQFDTNFKIPVSILLNLTKLKININSKKYLTFINDLKVGEYSLKKLKYLKIKRQKNEKNSSNIRKSSPVQSKNKIKLSIPNIEILIINADLTEDLYIFKEYFKFHLIDDKIYDKLSLNSIYNYFKDKILNYEFRMMTVYFKLELMFRKNPQKLLLDYEVNRSKNGLNNYYFKRFLYSKKNYKYNISESYKENCFNEKILTLYVNRYGFDVVDELPLIDKANYVVLISKEKTSLNRKEIVNLFDINKNNYSIQHIIINLGQSESYFTKLINNIDKLKVLKNLIIKDYIDKFGNLLRLVQNIAKLDLLKTVKINFKGNLSHKALRLIKKNLPNITYTKNYNSDLYEFIYFNKKNY